MHNVGTIVVTGGGTGGHIYPALAVADEMQSRNWKVIYAGTENGLESRIVPEAGYRFRSFPAKPFYRGNVLGGIAAAASHFEGLLLSLSFLKKEQPDVILGTGGFASFPVCSSSLLLGFPLVLHEQNVVPGRANRLLAKRAKSVLTAWEPRSGYTDTHWRTVGMPVRKQFSETNRIEARKKLGIEPNEKLVLVFGGSRGAFSLNNAMKTILSKGGWNGSVLWATGDKSFEEFKDSGASTGTTIVPYLQDMPAAMAAADLAVTRAGAMTLAELSASSLPSVLIPYPHAMDDHQTANALTCVEAGASETICDEDLGARLYDCVEKILDDPQKLKVMSAAAGSLNKPDVALIIADELERVAKDGRIGNKER